MGKNINQLTNIATSFLTTDKFYLGRSPFAINDDYAITGASILSTINAQNRGLLVQSATSYTMSPSQGYLQDVLMEITSASQNFTLSSNTPSGQPIRLNNRDITGTTQDVTLQLPGGGGSLGIFPANTQLLLWAETAVGGTIFTPVVRCPKSKTTLSLTGGTTTMTFGARFLTANITTADATVKLVDATSISAVPAGEPIIVNVTGSSTKRLLLQDNAAAGTVTMIPGGVYAVTYNNNKTPGGGGLNAVTLYEPCIPYVRITSTTYTVDYVNLNGLIVMENASPCTVTFPSPSSLPTGTSSAIVQIKQGAAGIVTAAGSVNSATSLSTQVLNDIMTFVADLVNNVWTRNN